jgi:prepilin signal peptidase PulO-like enzyme (type II secretory pathway)
VNFLELRLAVLAIVGAALGSLVNLAVYRLAWHQRSLSPWSAPLEQAPPRRWSDRIPIVGWIGLRREASLHGRGFWIRPMLVEVVMAVGLAWLYWWEVEQLALIRPMTPPPSAVVLHVQFFVHAFLLTSMLAGSLIDVDEKTIPDAITVPGTLVALALAALFPWSLLPDVVRTAAGAQPQSDFLLLTSPNPWPTWLDGFPQWKSLAIAVGCWWGWCFALMPRTWYSRHGWCRAIGLSWARLRREAVTYRAIALGLLGAVLIALFWWLGGKQWQGLLTALVGMAAGGGIIWSVRIVGTAVLRREAMGFGDVTLMAMIGAFLGWQSCLVIFFLAPFAGLIVGVFSLALHRESEIPYGPFLCMAATFVILRWSAVWLWAEPLFGLGLIIPAIFLVGLAMMAGLLGLWRAILG